jgi:hypothetical protein
MKVMAPQQQQQQQEPHPNNGTTAKNHNGSNFRKGFLSGWGWS